MDTGVRFRPFHSYNLFFFFGSNNTNLIVLVSTK